MKHSFISNLDDDEVDIIKTQLKYIALLVTHIRCLSGKTLQPKFSFLWPPRFNCGFKTEMNDF